MDIGSVIIGFVLGLATLPGLILNTIVICTLVKGRFIRRENNVLYIVAMNLLISDNLHLLVIGTYLAPASALQSYLFPGGPHDFYVRVISFVGQVTWHIGRWMLNTFAINRFIQICHPEYGHIFTRRIIIIICLVVWPISGLMVALNHFWFPCCEILVYYPMYTFSYMTINGTINYSDTIINSPFDALCVLISVVCYSLVFAKMRRSRKILANRLDEKEATRRRQQEFRFAQQFIAISIFFTLTAISFRVYPLLLTSDEPKLRAMTTIFSVLNASMTSVAHIRFNSELSDAMWLHIFGKVSASTHAQMQKWQTMAFKVANDHRSNVPVNQTPVPLPTTTKIILPGESTFADSS